MGTSEFKVRIFRFSDFGMGLFSYIFWRQPMILLGWYHSPGSILKSSYASLAILCMEYRDFSWSWNSDKIYSGG